MTIVKSGTGCDCGGVRVNIIGQDIMAVDEVGILVLVEVNEVKGEEVIANEMMAGALDGIRLRQPTSEAILLMIDMLRPQSRSLFDG